MIDLFSRHQPFDGAKIASKARHMEERGVIEVLSELCICFENGARYYQMVDIVKENLSFIVTKDTIRTPTRDMEVHHLKRMQRGLNSPCRVSALWTIAENNGLLCSLPRVLSVNPLQKPCYKIFGELNHALWAARIRSATLSLQQQAGALFKKKKKNRQVILEQKHRIFLGPVYIKYTSSIFDEESRVGPNG